MTSLIVAVDDNNAIGFKNDLPWGYIKEDMKWFVSQTKDNVVAMGRNTWDSLQKPLPNRVNIVITSNDQYSKVDGIDKIAKDHRDLELMDACYPNKELFIIGGAMLYQTMAHLVDTMYISRIRGVYEGDTFFDPDTYLADFHLISTEHIEGSEDTPAIDFQIWKR